MRTPTEASILRSDGRGYARARHRSDTAILSILRTLILRSLPVTVPDRPVVVSRDQLTLPYPLFRYFQEHNDAR